MNETLKIIGERFSCRGYDGNPIAKDKLDAIALAGVQAPSAMNLQPWQIVVITDRALLDEMDTAGMAMLAQLPDRSAYDRFMGRGGKLFYNSPCMFLILQTSGNELDCGIVSENISLAAASLGLGSCICGMARLSFASERADYFREKIGFPEGYDFAMSVLVGQGTVIQSPHKPDMAKVRFI